MALVLSVLLMSASQSFADDSDQVLTIDHFVSHVSTAPSTSGQIVQLYVRERVQAATALSSPSFAHRVVLFVHGASTPSSAAFDLQYQDYSWMAYLAQAGLDVFGVDSLGYGRSDRPSPMGDPCNADAAAQPALIPSLLPDVCPPSYSGDVTTIASDRDDLDAVVDYVRSLRHVDTISLVGWSRGGPRAGGYAGMHPEKVDSLVVLAPAYMQGAPPAPIPSAVMSITTRQGFEAGWDNQVSCPNQIDPGLRDPLWSQLIESDPVGAGWGPGVFRAPTEGNVAVIQRWGDLAGKIRAPTLLISGETDKTVLPDNVRALYGDLQTSKKVFAALPCSSHYAAYETRHATLFQASAEWLLGGTVNGESGGTLRLGD